MGLVRKLFFALLFCVTLFARDSGPTYLNCAHFLDGLSPEQKRLRNTYWNASEPPEEEDRDDAAVIRSWHNDLIAKTEILLTSLGIDYERTKIDEQLPAIRLLANETGNELNRFIATFQQWLGVDFLYAPARLMKEGGRFSRAKYSKSRNAIFLSHEFVDGISADESLHHEILHAVFNWFRNHQVDSPFHGELSAWGEGHRLWEGKHYAQRLSFEELATYPVNLALFAKGARAMAEAGLLKSVAAQRVFSEIQRKALIFSAITAGAESRFGELLDVLEGDTPLKVTYSLVQLPRVKTEGISAGRAVIKLEQFQAKILLVNEVDIELVRQFRETPSDELRRRLNRLVAGRILKLKRLAKELHVQAERILGLTAMALELIESTPLSHPFFEKYLAALVAPRSLTLPFVTSLDGKPSIIPAPGWLPRPENAP